MFACLNMAKLLLLLLSILLWQNVFAYNILVVFPYPAISHTILGDGYVRHLLKAGHEVTYITAKPIKPHPKLKQVDLSSNVESFELAMIDLNINTFLTRGNQFRDISFLYELMSTTSNMTMTHENVQKFLMKNNERFDVVIIEWIYSELYCGLAAIFDIPYIWSSSLEPHQAVLQLIDEPLNPAYFPDNLSLIAPPFTFVERVSELWKLVNLYWIRWHLRENDEKMFRDIFGPAAAKRGINLPTLEELKYKSSMMLGMSHVSSGDAHKLPQNYIPISGYHIEDEIAALPENLQKIMDNAPNGVIYFSMGSMMKSRTMPLHLKRDILKTFSELKQTVIWKFEEELTGLPKNVHIVQWAPQQSILAHPNCIIFVTHGGLLSITEALHFGVPIIGIPLFSDQNSNVLRAVKKGYGLQVDLGFDTPAKLKVAIQEMISNPKYRDKVKELSFVYHHRPTKPGAALVHWVEHVIETKGAPHLRSPALYIPLYQKLYLDLIALILIGTYIVIRMIKKLLGESQKSVSKKKNN